MGEFGWAYISGSAPIQSAGGTSGSVQIATTSGGITGSSNFIFKNESDALELSGTLGVSGSINVQGDITASNFVIQNVTEINASGSSQFGNSSDDTHQFTGSVTIQGGLTASTHVSASSMNVSEITASYFVGDGSNLTNLPAATGITHGNSGQYRLITSVNSTSIQGESNLTWEGSNLRVTGSVLVTTDVRATNLSGSGANLFNLNAGNVSAGTLDNARLPTSISVSNLTGAMSATGINAGTLNNARLPATMSVSAITGSNYVSASNFYGDGSALTNISTINIASDGANRLLVADGDGTMTAQSNLTYDGTTLVINDDTEISGSLIVSGTLTANVLVVSSTGSTIIGNSSDDTHQMTGSFFLTGAMSASSHVSASAFIGDGSQITNLPPYGSPAIATYDTPGQYRLITSVNSNTVQGESDLTWQGANLRVTGSVLVSSDVEAASLSGSQIVTGKVGIGTQNPAQKLTVDTGNIQLTNGYQLQWGDADTAIFGNATTDYVRVKTAGLDRFSVDSSGKVGIGTINPEGKLHVYSGNANTAPSTLADELVVEGTGSTGISILTPNNQVGRLYFGDSDNAARGYVLYDHSSDIMKFSVASANRLVINNAGNVGIGHSYPENPDHKLAVIGDISASVNVSASAFYGDGSNLSNVGGTITVKEEGANLTTQATSIDFVGAHVTASATGDAVTVTVNAGAGGAIGTAEDGNYADGLFTDFTAGTAVGTAVDRFNEVLKILAPSPAPGVQHIGVSTSNGITAKLSFGASAPVTGITSSGTGAGWTPAIDRNEVYAPATDGFKRRLGIYNNQDITGIINYDIAASITNGNYAYREDSFGNGETGTLKLELNGDVVHSINLATFTGAGNPPNGTDDTGVNGNGSGFVDVSIAANTLDGNGASWGSIFKYRSADYIIKAADQKRGWNYLRVIHTIGSSDAASNYIEWINDPAPPGLSVANARIEDINLVGSRYLSGVKYSTDATAKYKADLLNMYRDVYPNGGTPISFSVTNSTIPSSEAVDPLGGGDDNTKTISLTASLNFNRNPDVLLGGSISCSTSATHPLKSDISNQGNVSATGFLIDNRTIASDNDTENFHDETFRKASGSYNTQASVTASAADWNSQTHMNNGGSHDDGLLFYNTRLYSPKQGAYSGNFSSAANGPVGNPDYSGVSGHRTFYRVLTASTGQAYDVRVITSQAGTTFNNSALGTGNMHMFVKIPGTTGWMDATQTFTYGQIGDGNGALNPTANNTATTRYLTFGTASVANNDHIMFKFVADSSWTGYISSIEFDPNVSTATNAAVLSTIDVDQNGTNAKLSFGSSNVVATHTSVEGQGTGSMTDIDSNGAYTSSGNRKGVFLNKPTVEGDVNGNGGQFRNAYSGSLILEVNGVEVHSVNLKSLNAIPNGVGYDVNSSGSGFDLAALAWRQGPANANDYRYPYRTGKYKVHPNDQRIGWNYVRVLHRVGGGDTPTSYGQWVVDDDSSTLTATNVSLTNFGHTDVYYQSGVRYFASRPTGSFSYTMSNVYKNVYWNGSTGITFPTKTNCTVTNTKASGPGVTTLDASGDSKSLPALNNSANCQNQDLHVTGTVLFNNLTSISGAYGSNAFTKYGVSIDGKIRHPFKADETTAIQSKAAFMHYSGAIGSTNEATEERFNTEHYRIVNNAYANQAAVTSSAQTWNSQTIMNAGGTHDDGVVTVNGYMISPLKIGNAGDTRNTANGGTLQAPAGSPDYSTLSNNTRTFYRYFKNNSGVLKQNNMSITVYGDAYLVGKSGAYNGTLGANKNMHIEIKVPSDPVYTGGDDKSTGWCDAIKDWDDTEDATIDGAGILNGSLTQTVPPLGRVIPLEFQTKGIYNNQYFVVKISVHKDWTGYLSRIRMAYS